MIIPTIGNGLWYQVKRNKQAMLTAMEHRKAIRYCIAIAVSLVIIGLSWHYRPVVILDKGGAKAETTQRDR